MKSPTPFSALTKAKAIKVVEAMAKSVPRGDRSITLHGSWSGRRFVIFNATASPTSIAKPIADVENLSLTLPFANDWEAVSRACAAFGATVAALFRKRKVFENVADNAGVIHSAHAYHHVSLCGHRGPWGEGHVVGVEVPVTCASCAKIAATMPAFRARYHPLR